MPLIAIYQLMSSAMFLLYVKNGNQFKHSYDGVHVYSWGNQAMGNSAKQRFIHFFGLFLGCVGNCPFARATKYVDKSIG